MLRAEADLYCGIFDSRILRKNTAKSPNRLVECYELELFHTDTGVSHIDEKTYPVRRGMLLCAKPGQIRYSNFPVRCSFIRIFPDGARRLGLESLLSSLPDCAYLDDAERVERLLSLFARLGACFVGTGVEEAAQVKINALFFEILYHCLRSQEKNASRKAVSANRLAQGAYEYINEHYAEPCPLSRIAEALSVSPNHLHAVFTRQIGTTPLECVIQKRVEHAKRLIVTGEKTMLEIALEVGFCSQSHFNKIFKEQTGMTPVQYRKRLWEQY